MRILSWNCWGASRPPTVRSLKALARKEGPEVFFIAEIKAKSLKIDKLKNSMGFSDYFCVESVGKSGGLALFWKDGVELEVIFSNKYSIVALVFLDPSGSPWLLMAVHGSPYLGKKRRFWELMEDIITRFSGVWLEDGSYIFLLLYVDDMLIAAKSMCKVNRLKSLLHKEFEMKDLGATKKILGMEIHKDKEARKLWLSHKNYIKKVLEKFSMLDAKPVSTLLANHFKLFGSRCPKNEEEIENLSKVPYASAVGCLMYAIVCTKPDLAHAVSTVSKYMANPGRKHWNVVK